MRQIELIDREKHAAVGQPLWMPLRLLSLVWIGLGEDRRGAAVRWEKQERAVRAAAAQDDRLIGPPRHAEVALLDQRRGRPSIDRDLLEAQTFFVAERN